MGIIRAIRQTIGGTLADQWLEVIEPENMGDQTVLTAGIRTGKGANRKGGKDSISNGSVIHVYEGQFMMLLDDTIRMIGCDAVRRRTDRGLQCGTGIFYRG